MRSSPKLLKLDKLCRLISESNDNIRSVKIIGKRGAVLEKVGSDNIMTQPEYYNKPLNECHLDIALGREFGEFYGPIRYHHSGDKLVMFSFPLEENFVLISTSKNISPIELASKIALIIDKYLNTIRKS